MRRGGGSRRKLGRSNVPSPESSENVDTDICTSLDAFESWEESRETKGCTMGRTNALKGCTPCCRVPNNHPLS